MTPLLPDAVGELRLQLESLQVRYDWTTQRLDRVHQVLVEWTKGKYDDAAALDAIQSIVGGYDRLR